MEPVTVRVYVDFNYVGNLENRRSHSEILIYVNNILIKLYRKRYNTFESSSFGLEFVELRISTNVEEVLRYNIRTFGVNIEVPAEV